MPGPPPKLDPARRHTRVGPLRLPAEGRQGEPPLWPLTRQSTVERKAWADLWHTPHAVAWERLGWTRTVARYCRFLVVAEAGDATPAELSQVLALEDRLGLTPKAMRMLLWEIATDEVAEKRDESKSARGRIKAVG